MAMSGTGSEPTTHAEVLGMVDVVFLRVHHTDRTYMFELTPDAVRSAMRGSQNYGLDYSESERAAYIRFTGDGDPAVRLL